jgi:hypothetical protein
LQKIDLRNIAGELAGPVGRVFRANAKADHGPDIAQDGMPATARTAESSDSRHLRIDAS